jgi:hypothetical protein
MRLDYSSTRRTTERYLGRHRSITKLRTRALSLRTESRSRKRERVDWESIIVLLARVLVAVAKGLIGSGKSQFRLLPELKNGI